MTGGGRFTRVDMTNDDKIDVNFFFTHFKVVFVLLLIMIKTCAFLLINQKALLISIKSDVRFVILIKLD
jgi:hypothetical protein